LKISAAPLDPGTIAVMSSGQGSVTNDDKGGFEVYRTSKSALNQLMRSNIRTGRTTSKRQQEHAQPEHSRSRHDAAPPNPTTRICAVDRGSAIPGPRAARPLAG
jgi:hypothetical protein